METKQAQTNPFTGQMEPPRVTHFESNDLLEFEKTREQKYEQYQRALIRVVEGLYLAKGLSQAEFAENIHLPQTTINAVLRLKRKWSVRLLLYVADWAGKKPSELMALAEQVPDDSLRLQEELKGFRAATPGRLTALLRYAAEASDADSKWYTAEIVKQLAPRAYLRYTEGRLSDELLYRVIRGARDRGLDGPGLIACLDGQNS